MSATCPSCGRPQTFGILCADCCTIVETILAAVPQLVAQLDVTIAKQAKIGSGGKAGKGSAHERLPLNWGTVATRDQLITEAAFVGQDIDWLRGHVQAAEMVRDLGAAVKDAYHAIDRARDRQYLGQCLTVHDGEQDCECVCHGHGAYKPACDVPGGCGLTHGKLTCHAELWVKPGALVHKCSQCETVHDVPERREKLLEDAQDLVVTPREAAQYIGEVGGIRVGHQRIRNYLDRGRLAKRPSPDGALRLRLGDLLDILRDDATRHDVRAS